MSGLKDFKVADVSEFSKKGNQKLIHMTKEDWVALGTELFGPDMLNWEFVCPACGNVAKVEDYRQYKDHGATPDTATCNCIGRYDGHMNVDMGTGKPCNYTGYGLFDLCPVRVMDGEHEIRCFAFATKDESQNQKTA